MLILLGYAYWRNSIREFPQPVTQRKSREFLGLVNFYRRFIPHCATTLQPLNDLLKHNHKPSDRLEWSDSATTAFSTIKGALASSVAVGAVLQQYVDGQWQPLAFFSKVLKPAETRYSTYDRELLAIFLAIKHFRYFLEGQDFHILTDHKPLVYAFSAKPDRHSPCVIRQLDLISQFTTDLRYVQGSQNAPADTLSRLEVNALHTGDASVVDFRALALAQVNDPELACLKKQSSLRLQAVPLMDSQSCVMSPHPFRDPMFLLIFVEQFSTHCMACHTQVSGQHNASLRLTKCEHRCAEMGSLMSEVSTC